MKTLLPLLLLMLFASSLQAEYSRTYFDAQPVQFTDTADTNVAYRVFNKGPDRAKILLIMGLGGSGAAWGDAFIRRLVTAEYEVIVIDNRDTGLSPSYASWGEPTLWWQLLKYNLGWSVDAPYSLADMAEDNLAVLDALTYPRAHVVGVSMGGMIAQVLAARYPERVESLTSIMSTTFAPHLPPPSSGAEDGLRDLAGGKAELSRDEVMRARGFHPESMTRHLTAIFKTGDRTEEVTTILRPTLVIHGSDDRLIPPEHGIHTAENIQGAQFVLIDGMGHNLQDDFQPQIVVLMTEHFRTAEHDSKSAPILTAIP